MEMKITLDPGAYMPTRAHEADAGLDLYAMEDAVVFPYSSKRFDTGVHIAIPTGFVGLVTSKSGMMANNEITSRGTIDSGYVGSIHVVLFNHGKKGVYIQKGQKISQLVILKCELPTLALVESLEETERGNGGFGSTGKF